jgi:hypothetical protein
MHGNITRKLPCSYLYLKLAKMSCFSFYLFPFLFCKIREQKEEQVLPKREGWHQWKERREVAGKEGRRVNMVQKMCTHAYKYKNDTG